MSVLREGEAGAGRQAYALPLDSVWANPRQPRQAFDDFSLMELASSIRQHGLLQPITVRAVGEGYEIIMGERRYRACKMLGWSKIDAFILPAGPEESAEMALIENLQRENLHYFEEAEAYARLLSQGMTQEKLAHRLGKSVSGVANKLRLLKLDDELRRFLWQQNLSERHARALLTLPDDESRRRVAEKAAENHLTVRETEALALRYQKRLPVAPPARKIISLVQDHRLYVNALRSIVDQMRQTGLRAEMESAEDGDWISLRIRVKKTR